MATEGKAAFKVCSSCSEENPLSATSCASCGKGRFEPKWVKAHRPLNRQFAVQITETNPEYGQVQDRITLTKWWPGGNSNLHLPNAEQWAKVVQIIETELGPLLGWQAATKLAASAAEQAAGSKMRQAEVANLAKQHPAFLKELAEAIDASKFSPDQFGDLVDTLAGVSDALTSANAGFREAYVAILKKLPSQKQRALEDLAMLLEGWSLNVVTNVAQQVRTRLQTIELFEEQIQDERTFEIAGENSIHRILERAMWLVNEEYWLLHSNATLRTQIGNDLSKKDKKSYGAKRPDFVCGTVGQRLIILELKRPGHELRVKDLDQLETYLAVSKKYFKANTIKGFLVGSSLHSELQERLEFRRGSDILLYANLIDGTKERYTQFLKSLD